MISKECFVYIQLPDTLESVTAGRLEWERAGSRALGRFVYGQKYLKTPRSIALHPFQLPLEEREFECFINDGIHGPLRDASPDRWGRYVIEKNLPHVIYDEIAYLLNGAEDRVGALSFGLNKVPPAVTREFNKTLQLDRLIAAAHKLEQELPVSASERALLLAGASMGGARPKTTIEDKNELWLAKFPSYNDRNNISKIEYGTMKLAEACGLRVPPIRLIQIGRQDVFLIRRFDREWNTSANKYAKKHFVSSLTVMNLDENDRDQWSYIDFADEIHRWIKNADEDLHELYSRLIFNSLISNSDDHPRNHGLVHIDGNYRLSPVYDLLPRPEIGSDRFSAMAVGNGGRSFRRDNILSRCDAFGLNLKQATHIYNQMREKVSDWRHYFEDISLSVSDMNYLASAFCWESK